MVRCVIVARGFEMLHTNMHIYTQIYMLIHIITTSIFRLIALIKQVIRLILLILKH